jgi:ABC-type glycerol-3-phosphate transport system substrate-binding protein
MFLDEKIMLYLSGRWMYPKIKETANFPWGIVPFPGVSPADASGWAISKSSKHKDSAKTDGYADIQKTSVLILHGIE